MTTPLLAEFDDLFNRERKEILNDFFRFLRFPSVSSEASYAPQVRSCAEWFAAYLRDSGFAVEIWETTGHPVLFASWSGAAASDPTALFYGHYDVQPVDPLEQWLSPPFEPTVRGDNVYARGAQDNKGQIFYVASALRALLKRRGRLPLNVKLLIEGEEECGSPGLSAILPVRRSALAAQHLLVVDVGLKNASTPTVTVGCRGLVTLTATVRGSNIDLHSGMHGGIAYNPNHALTEMLARLRRPDGSIAVPHFYDAVVMPTQSEREHLDFGFDEQEYHRSFGVLPVGGECAFSPLESNWLRPTLEINGLRGGYLGDGFKTVIPAEAVAKISCRLVPNQEPLAIGTEVKRYLESLCPSGVCVDVVIHPGVGEPVRARLDAPVVQAAAAAFSEVFAAPAHFVLDGATIPIVSQLCHASGADPVLIGYGLPDDHIHAPNECFGLDRFRRGYITIARLVDLLGTSAATST